MSESKEDRLVGGAPEPFLRWVGSKRALLPELLQRIPARWWTAPHPGRVYHEPFLGAGAVYFALARRIGDRLQAHLSDANPHLIGCWQAVFDDAAEVARIIGRFGRTEEDFYSIRDRWNRRLTGDLLLGGPAVRAAEFLYLNKLCFNGLYRTAPHFLRPEVRIFNVPFGHRDPNQAVFDGENQDAIRDLRRPGLAVADFEIATNVCAPGDLVYFDPPYVPVNRFSKTDYGDGAFGYDEQERLADTFDRLARAGVFVVLSNADTPWVRDRYNAHTMHPVEGLRQVSGTLKGRESVRELIIVGG